VKAHEIHCRLSTKVAKHLLLACWKGLDDVAMVMLELDAVACNSGAVNRGNMNELYWARVNGLTNVALRLLR